MSNYLDQTLYAIQYILQVVSGWLLSGAYGIRDLRTHLRWKKDAEERAEERAAKAALAVETRQKRCAKRSHSKGGRIGIRGPVVYPNVHMHTFLDGSQRIWCGWCGYDAWNRKSGKTANWDEAKALLEQSLNTPSSSEIPVPGGATVVMRQPLHGHDEFIQDTNTLYGKQIRLKEDDSPIKGYKGSKWRLPEATRAIQNQETGEVFIRGDKGEAISLGVSPIGTGPSVGPVVASENTEEVNTNKKEDAA